LRYTGRKESSLTREGVVAKAAEKNLIDVPLYTPLDVARYLRAPVWLVICAWWGRIPPHPEMFFHWFDRWPHHFGSNGDLSEVSEFQERWSFRQAADLYVRLFAVEALTEMTRSEEGGRADSLTEAAWGVFRNHLSPPLIFRGDGAPEEGIARLVGAFGDRLRDEERRSLEKKLVLCLGRFDLYGNDPSRLYPFSRVPAEGSPRVVVMDPGIRFGRPTVAGHGTPTDVLQERHQAGDSIADLADDFDIPAQEVEESLRYEAKPISLIFPFFCW
jgi:uncharacterized protein (DUF433 family)